MVGQGTVGGREFVGGREEVKEYMMSVLQGVG